MSNNAFIIGQIAIDLKRSALALHQNSNDLGERFLVEANKKVELVKSDTFPNYVKQILGKISETKDKEYLLTYSVQLQNYATRK